MASNPEVNPMQRTSLRFFLLSMCGALLVILLLGHAGIAVANVPDVLQIENISQGSAGRVRLEIAHLNPSGGHYVDVIEVQVAGVTKEFDLQPQSSNPFTVELDLGELQGTPDVRARAHCNLHGWSTWSQTIAVPEFPEVATVASALFVALLAFRAGTIIHKTQERRD